ncbi:MAG: fasciclin domain-containing protein [Ilumatobacteraceae bacterium]|nr:fasciclin domain-containing protein [Ilumatobacteraceae bacterium]
MPDDPNTPEPPNDPAGVPPTEPIPIVPQTPDPPLPPTTQMSTTPTDPNLAVPNGPRDPRWYENRAATASLIAIGLITIFLLIGWLLWWSDDDDSAAPADTIGTAVVVDGSTVPTIDPTTIPPASVVQGTPVSTVVATLPPESTAPTTALPATTVAPTTVPTTEATTTSTSTSTTTTTSVPVVSVPASPSATVMDILAVSPDLSRLEELVIDADLVETLAGDEPMTLFAPSNQAIETLEAAPGGAELLADPDRLRNLLLGHVVPGELDIATILAGQDLTSLSGSILAVDAATETIGGANAVVTDVTAANGVLHVIDRVFDEA